MRNSVQSEVSSLACCVFLFRLCTFLAITARCEQDSSRQTVIRDIAHSESG